MARGKRTDPAHAMLVKVMAEMGFESGMIAEIAPLKRSTVNDIIRGHGTWAQMPQSELFGRTRLRVRAGIENAAESVAIQAIARLHEKIKTASITEALSVCEAPAKMGGLFDEEG
jgi:hypothetical protein